SGFVSASPVHQPSSPTSNTGTPPPNSANAPCRSPCVSTATGSLSWSMYRSRSPGYSGSTGTYAPPAFNTPNSPMIISQPLPTPTTTQATIPNRSPPTPPPPPSAPPPTFPKDAPPGLARRFSSPYLRLASSNTTAVAHGVLAACSSNNSYTHLSAGYSASVRFH